MTDVNNTIEYIISVKDNSSATLSQIRESSNTAQQSVNRLTSSQQALTESSDIARTHVEELGSTGDSVGSSVKTTLDEVDMHALDSKVNLIATLGAINGLKGALNGSIGSMKTLGLLTDEEAAKLNMVSSAFGLVASVGQGLTAIRTLMAAINVQSGILATIQTYTATLSNPAKLALVGGALGAAGTVGGYMLGSYMSSSTTNNTTITVEDTSTNAGQTASNIYYVLNGGAL